MRTIYATTGYYVVGAINRAQERNHHVAENISSENENIRPIFNFSTHINNHSCKRVSPLFKVIGTIDPWDAHYETE